MIFEFLFSTPKNKNSIKDFISILEFWAFKKKIKSCSKFVKSDFINTFHFFLNCSSKEALNFADEISLRLPLSIYFSFEEFKISQEKNLRFTIKPIPQLDFFDSHEISKILDQKNPKFCKIFNKVKSITFQDKKIINTKELQEVFSILIQKLKNNQDIFIDTTRGAIKLSLSQKSNQIMFFDLANATTYTRIDSIQSQILASYEKPVLKVLPKEVFCSQLLDKEIEINIFLPYDIMLSILGVFALKANIDYVFISLSKEYDLSYQYYPMKKAESIVVSDTGLIINNDRNYKSKNIFELFNYYFKEQSLQKPLLQKSNTPLSNHQKLIIYLSKNHPSCIWIKDDDNYKDMLSIDFETNPKKLIQDIKNHYKDGDKLIKNFQNHFEDIMGNINALSNQSLKSKNLMDMLGIAGFILGYDKKFDLSSKTILNNAKKFVRDRGPRIDFKLVKKNNQLSLDYPKIIRSSMSFRIAGLDEATLSYGFLDSMAEFLGNFVRDGVINFSIKSVLICGNMLAEKIFLDKILHYIPKNIDLILPEKGYIDYKA